VPCHWASMSKVSPTVPVRERVMPLLLAGTMVVMGQADGVPVSPRAAATDDVAGAADGAEGWSVAVVPSTDSESVSSLRTVTGSAPFRPPSPGNSLRRNGPRNAALERFAGAPRGRRPGDHRRPDCQPFAAAPGGGTGSALSPASLVAHGMPPECWRAWAARGLGAFRPPRYLPRSVPARIQLQPASALTVKGRSGRVLCPKGRAGSPLRGGPSSRTPI
jgi:hypothetical protein